MNPKLTKILEALLISTSEPLTVKDILKLFRKYEEQLLDSKKTEDEESEAENEDLGTVKKKDLELALQSITEEAELEDRAYRLVDGPKGFYLATAPQFSDYIVQIDDFMRKDKEFESEITDETVGLAKETKPSELPLEETFVEVDWQKENMESDAYIEKTEE